MKDTIRYRDCSWLVKRWRDRHLLVVPLGTLLLYYYNHTDYGMDWAECWRMAMSECDKKRENWYSIKEARAELGLDWDDSQEDKDGNS